MEQTVRRKIRVYGIVQGVGFRPFVSRTAKKCGITGSVCNKGPYVEIFAEGRCEQVADFTARLTKDAPARSAILKVEGVEVPPEGDNAFSIIKSAKVKGDIFVSPDIAICDQCKKELFDPDNRRYLHPFINCTACGPRLTILDSMPYDRVRTSMGEFPMCPECEDEYTHARSRRYHAQPVCCNDCGPHLYLIGTDLKDRDAIIKTREVIRNGGIAAIKGIGGFHLCCDATNASAVARLRKLKDRPMKPFAVMLKDMNTVLRECVVEEGQEEIIEGPQKPILLLPKKLIISINNDSYREHKYDVKDNNKDDISDNIVNNRKGDKRDCFPDKGCNSDDLCAGKMMNTRYPRICNECAPDNPNIGVMLPYAPVQLLLFDYPDGKPMTDCFVMTSGNPRGAPICMTDAEAVSALSSMCDVMLSNNRRIRIRADDSVMAWADGKPYMIRRSRGYAPLPFMTLQSIDHRVLAAGGELKNTFCLATGDLYYPSPYIGDLADLRSVEALGNAVTRMERLLEIEPEAVACDLHPRYNSSAFAREYADKHKIPCIEVQHHYAHVAACMAENDVSDDVIGVSFDGTGYGTDGTIWGGEFLLSNFRGFERLGSIETFPQAGGDMAAKEGWRIAVSLILQASKDRTAGEELIRSLNLCDENELRIQEMMIERKINCVTSTSAGRLFDAVSAILGIRRASTFEGESSMALEFAAERSESAKSGSNDIAGFRPGMTSDGKIFRLDTGRLVNDIAKRYIAGEDKNNLAYFFHVAMSELIVAGCVESEKTTGVHTAALTGGVMQNLLLLKMVKEKLQNRGFRVLTHSLSPANDGGIALGQAAVAMERLKGE